MILATQEVIVYRNKLEQQTDEGMQMLLEMIGSSMYNYWYVWLIVLGAFFIYMRKKH